MRCREAEAALLERGLGRISAGRDLRLHEHLRSCPHCGELARAEAFLDADFKRIRSSEPPVIDVSDRVIQDIREIRFLPPIVPTPTSLYRWGWVAAGVLILAASAGAGSQAPAIDASLERLRDLLAAFALGSLDASRSLLGIFEPLAGAVAALFTALDHLARIASRAEPAAIAAAALAFLAMAVATTFILARDVRRSPRTSASQEKLP